MDRIRRLRLFVLECRHAWHMGRMIRHEQLAERLEERLVREFGGKR